MGGPVTTTIRRDNGETASMCQWTGSERGLFLNRYFMSGNFEQSIDDYMAGWKTLLGERKKEQDEDGETELFPLFTLNTPFAKLAPYGYGLTVIDFKDKHIYTCQSYSEPGSFYLKEIITGLSNSKESPVWVDLINSERKCVGNISNPDQPLLSIKEAFGTKNISDLVKIITFLDDSMYEDAKKLLYPDGNTMPIPAFEFGNYVTVRYELPQSVGFNRTHFNTTYAGHKQLLQALTENGFILSDEDLAEWVDFCNAEFAESCDETDHLTEAIIRQEIYAIVNKPIPEKAAIPSYG